jgi:hypothetical protein
VDLALRADHCGACGTSCGTGNLCAGGSCVKDTLTMLSFSVVDAEYSKALDRIVIAAKDPNSIQVYDPAGKSSVVIALPKPPSSISLAPDGLRAAVGHDGAISLVDLASLTVVKTMHVATDVYDVVFGANGFAYALPAQNQWAKMYWVNLTSNESGESQYPMLYAGSVGKLHPGGAAIYVATRGLSPSDLERYDLEPNGVPKRAYDAPYHGDYPVCGDLWFSDDGALIYTACGKVFRATNFTADGHDLCGLALRAQAVVRWIHIQAPLLTERLVQRKRDHRGRGSGHAVQGGARPSGLRGQLAQLREEDASPIVRRRRQEQTKRRALRLS